MNDLEYHKAGTADGTVNTMLKCGGEEMVRHLLHLFNWLRERESLPAEWQQSGIVNLHKDGDKVDPSNYRGIALSAAWGSCTFHCGLNASRSTRILVLASIRAASGRAG